jgi:hypothetical protein
MVRRAHGQNPASSKVFFRCASRNITEENVRGIRQVIANHRDWNRQKLSQHICKLWNWRCADGFLLNRERSVCSGDDAPDIERHLIHGGNETRLF